MKHGKYAYRVHKKSLKKLEQAEKRRKAILFQSFENLKKKLQ
jgi:hypothetical protein